MVVVSEFVLALCKLLQTMAEPALSCFSLDKTKCNDLLKNVQTYTYTYEAL